MAKIKPEGRVERVMVSDQPGTLLSRAVEQIAVSLEGFAGDRHSGPTLVTGVRQRKQYPRGTVIKNNRQVSLVSEEELAEIAETMGLPWIEPEWLGANLALTGIVNLTGLPPATRLYFPQGVTLVIEGENEPCRGPGRLIQQHYPDRPGLASAFLKAARHRRGLVGWVECAGFISQGNMVRVEMPYSTSYKLLP